MFISPAAYANENRAEWCLSPTVPGMRYRTLAVGATALIDEATIW